MLTAGRNRYFQCTLRPLCYAKRSRTMSAASHTTCTTIVQTRSEHSTDDTRTLYSNDATASTTSQQTALSQKHNRCRGLSNNPEVRNFDWRHFDTHAQRREAEHRLTAEPSTVYTAVMKPTSASVRVTQSVARQLLTSIGVRV